MVQIIDASVAIKWFVQEPGRDRALDLLSAILRSPRQYAVPELFFFELAHVFHRTVPHPAPLQVDLLRQITVLGLQRYSLTPELLAGIRRFQSIGLSGYDSAYVALAELLKGRWITCDRRAHEQIVTRRLSELL